ncbi:hypothetical protein D3C81_2059230 [compost metagenome]
MAEPQIIGPCRCEILIRPLPELEGAELGKRIVNVVERGAEDMGLLLPESALLQISVVFIVA